MAISLGDLSERQRQIAVMISEGKCYKTMSSELNIAESTIGNHVRNIYVRLRINNREDLIAFVRSHIHDPTPAQRSIHVEMLKRWMEYAQHAEQARAQGSSRLVEELQMILGTSIRLAR